jgi:hypothetical protein
MSRTMSYYDLSDALTQPGCPVCRLMARDTERYLDDLLWENVNDPDVRHSIRQAQGFCHEHAWQLDRAGASLGVAILMHDVLGSVLKVMEGARFQALPALSLRRAQESLDPGQPAAATADLVARLTAKAECPACIQARQTEEIYLGSLLDHLVGEDGLLAGYEGSDGLCLPHFRQALARVRDQMTFDALLTAQRRIWGRLAGHLGEFIRHNDYRFRDKPLGDEGNAWLRAIASLTGTRREPGRL